MEFIKEVKYVFNYKEISGMSQTQYIDDYENRRYIFTQDNISQGLTPLDFKGTTSDFSVIEAELLSVKEHEKIGNEQQTQVLYRLPDVDVKVMLNIRTELFESTGEIASYWGIRFLSNLD